MASRDVRASKVVLLVMLTVLLGAGADLGVRGARQYVANRSFRPVPIPAASPAGPETARVLAALTASPEQSQAPPASQVPTAAGVAAALVVKLRANGLGASLTGQVIDAASGISLLDRRSALAVSPASTAKLLVAAAILTVHKPTDRFTTRVVQGNSPGSVVLVGGGDPTLSGAAAGEESRYPGAARISDLAAQVTHNLGKAPAAAIRSVVVDGSLFTGARTAPGWDAGAAMLENVSPIVGVMMDGGRDDPASANRSAVPELAAGSALDSALSTASGQPHHADNPGARVTRGIVNQGARVLGEVHSAPVSRLVEQMLSESDNVVAEVLTRQVAVAAHRPATFAGGAAAVSETLAMIGIRVGHAMVDGSGLSVLNRVSVAALTGVLLRAADPGKPNLRPIVTGLPVAGWDGTLADRYSGLSRSGRGAVRAKTGTLDGVSAEAGLVTDSDGRQLVFAFIANGVPIGGTDQARVALDGLAATLAGCGCR